ncbi:hypothetical protein GS4_07_00670 [Gordonia soli NBRC 108243]|uniref:Uncharacterized protein n=1 Tax=Gordonia soli NBRC 108243 TaxID=1223545 RepID=M0QFH5_9ACTN|nr:hypothetical protein GS4_07_00670 [Gordonia soli NBRC 108243]
MEWNDQTERHRTYAEGRAGSQAEAHGEARIGRKGFWVGGGGFAGGKAEGKVGMESDKPSSTDVEAGVDGRVGIGVEIGGGIEQQPDGRLKIGARFGFAAGPGAETSITVHTPSPGEIFRRLNPFD